MSDRAVSNTVGVILIFGITIASVTALIAVGGAVIDDTRADAERSQMENSMSGFSSKASLVGLGEAGDQRFSLGRASEGSVAVQPDAGNVTLYINRTGESSREELNSTSLGAVVYESGDTEVAYQGGGVWQRRGDASWMISPPEYHYQLETLTFPIVTVSGDSRSSGDVSGRIRSGSDTDDWFPIRDNNTRSNPLENGTVLIEVESRYCDAWETFFTERSQSAVDEPCGNDETVTVDLTVPFTLTADSPVIAREINPTGGSGRGNSEGNTPTGGNGQENSEGDIPENWREDVVAPSASSEVDAKLAGCRNGNCNKPLTTGDIGPGEYNVSEDHTFDNVTFDTSSGDVTVAVDGDLDLKNIEINGGGNVTLYVYDELSVDDDVNSDGGADQLITLLHSDGNVEYKSDSFTGVIYAPKSTVEIRGAPARGNKGAIVAGVLNVRGNIDKYDFESADELDDFTLLGGDRPLTYLHVSENSVEVEFD